MRREEIRDFAAYQLYDAYHYKFYDERMSLPHERGGRPHIATIVNVDDEFAWVVPMSSREDKNGNKKIRNYLEKRADSDMVSIIEVDGVSDYYLVENAIPVPFEYVAAPFLRNGSPLRIIDEKSQNELSEKLETIRELKYKGLLTKGKMDMVSVEEAVRDYMNGYRYTEAEVREQPGLTVETKNVKEKSLLETIETKDELTVYWYENTQRYIGDSGASPKDGRITIENSHIGSKGYEFGAAAYGYALSSEEQELFDLRPIEPVRDLYDYEKFDLSKWKESQIDHDKEHVKNDHKTLGFYIRKSENIMLQKIADANSKDGMPALGSLEEMETLIGIYNKPAYYQNGNQLGETWLGVSGSYVEENVLSGKYLGSKESIEKIAEARNVGVEEVIVNVYDVQELANGQKSIGLMPINLNKDSGYESLEKELSQMQEFESIIPKTDQSLETGVEISQQDMEFGDM